MPDYSSFYTDFNHFNNKITQNENIRKAIMYAMDRKSFVEKINLGDSPALGIIPEHFLGLSKSFREENGAQLFEDNQKDKAKEYLAKGLQELGLKELPPLDMLIETSDISMKIAQKYQEDWKQVGITVNPVPVPWSEKMSRLQSGNFAMVADGWGPDYLDPMTFLELFETGNGNNYGQYSNTKYDELIEKARVETDKAKRMGYFYDAEKILIDDAVVAPNYYRVAHWTYKKYVTGVVTRGIGANVDFYWADIDMAAKNAEKK
jgi:oligopeptide transport system substrate-binding protein